MRLHLLFAAAIAVGGCLASPASAALVARQGGFYYDTVLDVTWMGDANRAKTSGYTSDGLVTQQGADLLAGQYQWQNPATGVLYTDWRLPTLGPDVGNYDPNLPGTGGQRPNGVGATGRGWGTPDDSGIYSELGWMYYANLGGRATCEAVGAEPCTYNPHEGLPEDGQGHRDTGPFDNLQLGFYWTDTRAVGTSTFWEFTFLDGNQNPAPILGGRLPVAYVWLVHDGDIAAAPTAPVPEPAAWTLMIAGFGGLGAALRRRRATGSAVA